MATEAMARRGAASMAKMMGLMCVADSKLGEFKEGLCPVTRTGDYSDVVDADGRIVPWQRVARLDASEMRQTRREIVDKLYTFRLNWEDAELVALRDHRRDETSEWDRPREDPGLKKQMEVLANGVVETGRKPARLTARRRVERERRIARTHSESLRARGQRQATGTPTTGANESTRERLQLTSGRAIVWIPVGYDTVTDARGGVVLGCQE